MGLYYRSFEEKNMLNRLLNALNFVGIIILLVAGFLLHDVGPANYDDAFNILTILSAPIVITNIIGYVINGNIKFFR